jgi:hypothetical protein
MDLLEETFTAKEIMGEEEYEAYVNGDDSSDDDSSDDEDEVWLQPFVLHSSGQLPLPHLSFASDHHPQSELILSLAVYCKANLRLLSLATFSF